MNYPDNFEKAEAEYNKNYDPYDEDQIEGDEDDRSEDDGNSQE
tara:strand:- start:1775 stop:1903 length:129 start_codon:yes stop_codon:yes gene_type:complete